MSRRLLALALVLLVPIAGPFLAWMVRGVRGGKIAVEPVAPRRRSRCSIEDVRRLGELPPVVERLLSRDAAERLAALVHLSSVGDANARRVLQWSIEHGPTEVVLEAALTLEELELRGQPKASPRPTPAMAPTTVTVPSRATIKPVPGLGALSAKAA